MHAGARRRFVVPPELGKSGPCIGFPCFTFSSEGKGGGTENQRERKHFSHTHTHTCLEHAAAPISLDKIGVLSCHIHAIRLP